MSNVITAKFSAAETTVKTSRQLYQYDYGQILKIEGVELPETFEVHFSSKSRGTALTVIGTDGEAAIPDELLRTGDSIVAYIYLHTGDSDGETVYKITISVAPRPEPADYEPAPSEASVIQQAIAALNAATGEAEQDAQDAADAADRAEDARDAAEAAAASIDQSMITDVVEEYLEDHPPTVTESDPTVPSWAKQAAKPSYTASEVGAVPTTRTVNGKALSADIALTASDVGAGTYSKPSGGIPKSDLAAAVQTSLGKADTALQSFTETDPTVPAWAKAANKPSYTAAEVGAVPTTRTVNSKALSADITLGASDVGAIAAPSSPATGDFLVYNGSAWGAAAPAKEVFVCSYNSTTSAEIEAAYQAGKICVVTYNSKLFQLVYRGNATSHTFACFIDSSATTGQHVSCSSDSWTAATAHELLRAPSSPSAGDFLVYNGSAWVAQTLAAWQAGSY